MATSYSRQVSFSRYGHDCSAKTARLNGDARKRPQMARNCRRQATTHEFQLADPFSKCLNDREGPMIERFPVFVEASDC